MGDVHQFPKGKAFSHTVTAQEMYAQPEPSDEMIWEVCPYTRHGQQMKRCLHCPKTYDDPDHGPMTDGCRVFAAEACRVMLAVQAREKAK